MRELVAERENLLAEAKKLTDAKIAEKFEIHPNTVWKATRYDTWKDALNGKPTRSI
jgi:uncharacterized protein YjcR